MIRNELVLARPRHVLDVRAHTAHALAAIGTLSLAAARVIDAPVSERTEGRSRPYRDDVRGQHRARVDLHGDNWRIR